MRSAPKTKDKCKLQTINDDDDDIVYDDDTDEDVNEKTIP